MTTDVPKNLSQEPSVNPVHDIVDAQTTDCCIFAPVLTSNSTFVPPAFLRFPILRDLPARLIGLGVFPVHVKT